MGRIQRCSEVSQARFMRLCCIYWTNECIMHVEDAEIEMGVDEFKELIRLKIIEHDADGSIQIKFLDEQYEDCTDISKSRSKAAKARWNKPKAKQVNANAMQNNTSAMQGNADKTRIEENREEQITLETEFDLFFKAYDKQEGRVPCQREWGEIDAREYPKILLHVGKYVAATPDKKFRKLPINYLKDRTWLDAELPTQKETTSKQQASNSVYLIDKDGSKRLRSAL
jgi:hypothetical protein